MQTLAQQITAATLNKPISQWHPAILISEDGRRKPVFVRTGQFAQGNCTHHAQAIKKVNRFGVIVWSREFYRLQKNGEFVSTGDEVITDDRANLWIETHKAGLILE